jgi:type II secretory pathway pseudopilin PulG
MMKYKCPQCGNHVTAEPDQVGGIVQCPHCANSVEFQPLASEAPSNLPHPTPQQPAPPQLAFGATPAVKSKKAVWSLVLGILSITCLWILGSIPAIILGCLGLKQIKQSSGGISGQGLAIAGISTGGAGLLLGLIPVGILASIATPAFVALQSKAQQTEQLNDIRQLQLGCRNYAQDSNGGFPPSLNALIPDYIKTEEKLTWTSQDGSKLAYIYFPGKTDSGRAMEPLIAAPEPIMGKRAVGYVGGTIRVISESEYSSLPEG